MIDQALIHYWLTTIVELLSRFGPRTSTRPVIDTSRRNFMKALGLGVAGAAVVYSFPSVVVSQNVVVPEAGIGGIGMRGLPYIVNNTGTYFGLSRSSVPGGEWFPAPKVSDEYVAAAIKAAYQQDTLYGKLVEDNA